MRRARTIIVVFVFAACAVGSSSAQTLTFSLFERYLESLRDQYTIAGLSAAVVQRGELVWESGLGKQDVDAGTSPNIDTPYFIGTLSQIFGSTLVLEKCMDQSSLELTDEVTRWVPSYPEPATTVGQLLTHQTAAGSFAYDPTRFARLTGVVEECADIPYRHILAGEVFGRLAMTRSVPGRQLDGVGLPGLVAFSSAELAHYNDVVSQMSRNYRVDHGRFVRSIVPSPGADAATGAITTVRDLAAFDKGLRDYALLTRDTLTRAWTQNGGMGGAAVPTGLGWFVQNYNNEALVWQFDVTKDAASSMIVRLPGRDITFIMLANTDGLTAPFGLAGGDATASPFVRLFLRFFAP